MCKKSSNKESEGCDTLSSTFLQEIKASFTSLFPVIFPQKGASTMKTDLFNPLMTNAGISFTVTGK